MRITKLVFNVNFLYLTLIAAEIAAILFLCLYLPSFLPLAFAVWGIWLFDFICAVYIASTVRPYCLAVTLLLMVCGLPVAGALMFFIGKCRKKHGIYFSAENKNSSGVANAAHELCGTNLAGYETAEYFENGETYLSSLISEIEKAEKRVCLEFYIIARGEIFAKVCAALKKALMRGAEVYIVFDGIGSAFRIRQRQFKELKALGAKIKIFHKLTPLPYSRLNFRDHRKIAVIDGKTVFTGGINLADEYANINSPFGYWKDTGIKAVGEVAKVLEGAFFTMFKKSVSVKLNGGDKVCLPYYDSPPYTGALGEGLYLQAISSAKRRIYIFTPYFCCGEKLECALAFAARRGVEVKIILPHIPDKKFAFELSKASARKLIGSGVEFYEFTPGFMHAKSLIADDKLFCGSYNFDYRSMYLNFECGILFDGEIVKDAVKDFENCIKLSTPFNDLTPSAARKILLFLINLVAPLM